MNVLDRLILWLSVIVFAQFLHGVGVAYGVLFRGELTTAVLSEALAFAGGVLIGLSFALSGLSYYLNIFDGFLKYRKFLGLVGYYLALIYSITLLFRFPEKYNLLDSLSFLTVESILGLSAMGIFTFMAIISGTWAVKRFGKTWRSYLRLGYVAYTLLIIRAVIVEGSMWSEWWTLKATVPPPRLLLSCFAIAVILLRIALEISLRTKQKAPVPVAPPAAIPVAPLVEQHNS